MNYHVISTEEWNEYQALKNAKSNQSNITLSVEDFEKLKTLISEQVISFNHEILDNQSLHDVAKRVSKMIDI